MSRAPPDSEWEASLRAFSPTLLRASSIGDDFRRRILYEIRRTPTLLRRVGVAVPPTSPQALTAENLHALRKGLPWVPGTFALHFGALRRFVLWSGNPLGSESGVWSVGSGSPSRRRWLTSKQLGQLFRSARGRERLLVALEGLNGLRRVEVLRLRWRDVDVDAHRLRVLGKGRHGGKWRVIPLFSATETELRLMRRQQPEDARVIDLSRSGADLILQRAVQRSGLHRAGIRVSHHDLRRTFGRLANTAGMDLVQLKNLYGHESLDQTVHYIGLDEDRMREGLERLAQLVGPLVGRQASRDEDVRPMRKRARGTPGDASPRPSKRVESPDQSVGRP